MFAKTLGSKLTVCAALLMGSIGSAQAVPAYWDDWAGNEGHYIDSDSPYSYTHNLTDPASGAFRPGIDSINSASLSIWLYDDAFLGDLSLPFIGLVGDQQETVGFKFDGNSWINGGNVNGNVIIWDDFDFIVTSLVADGMLNVKIRANRGDFRFGASHLEAWGSTSARAVPEPATLSMLGLGLIALGFAARRRKV